MLNFKFDQWVAMSAHRKQEAWSTGVYREKSSQFDFPSIWNPAKLIHSAQLNYKNCSSRNVVSIYLFFSYLIIDFNCWIILVSGENK